MSNDPELYDPIQMLTTDWRTFCLENRDRRFLLPCIEGDVEMNGRWLLLNLMMISPLVKRHRPISRDKHLMLEGIYDGNQHAKRLTQVSRTLEEYGYTREELAHDIIMTANDSLNMCYTHLGSFIRTMDILSIADTILQEEVKAVCTMDYGDLEDGNINRMETDFKAQCEKVDKILSGNTIDMNVFRAPLLCGALKKGQFYQFVLSVGPRTDTDDHIFSRPVVGSFLSGFKDIIDLTIESRSASKATHYNKTQMQNTQYMNRKIHIQNSIIRYLYLGDCGSTVYMTYEICKMTAKFFLGKFYLDGNGDLVELTEDRFDSVIGKIVEMRDVPTCRYTDGYCEVCGGTITRSFSRNGNVGFLANVNTGAPVAQQVLSTKHLTATDAVEYEVHPDLVDFLESHTNDIFLASRHRNKIANLAIGFQLKDIARLNDLRYSTSEKDIQAAYYTDIKNINVGLLQPDGTIRRHVAGTPMGGKTKTYPHLSPEILSVIRAYPDDIIIQDKIAWLLLRNIDPVLPIMQCTVVNNSIRRFVDRFRNLTTVEVEKYTSLNDFISDLTRLIWPKEKSNSPSVSSHITHISTLAKACLITNKKDYNVPVVTDPDRVMFSGLSRIIPMRSIGGLLSFERYNVVTSKPVTYITPKPSGVFDEFMGYQDLVELNEHYPVRTGSPIEFDA